MVEFVDLQNRVKLVLLENGLPAEAITLLKDENQGLVFACIYLCSWASTDNFISILLLSIGA